MHEMKEKWLWFKISCFLIFREKCRRTNVDHASTVINPIFINCNKRTNFSELLYLPKLRAQVKAVTEIYFNLVKNEDNSSKFQLKKENISNTLRPLSLTPCKKKVVNFVVFFFVKNSFALKLFYWDWKMQMLMKTAFNKQKCTAYDEKNTDIHTHT